jgi:AcrR family transcriptional regulator
MSKLLKSKRKLPKQNRSKAIVEAIYEATVRILPKIGNAGITTKKIADLAGISIGSLYQYFPNKESILTSVMDSVMNAELKKFETKVQEIDGRSMDDATSAMVDFALELFLTEKLKVREIFLKAPELGQLPQLFRMRQKVVERVAEEMKKHYPHQDQAEYIRVSFVAVNSVMGVIHTMMYDDNQNYSIDELAVELKTMLNSYFHKRAQI